MLDLIKAKATGFVKVKGVIMCILGAQHSQYANVIGTWVHEKLGKEDFNGVQDNFLDYLMNHEIDDYQDEHGVTPLFNAAHNGHASVTEQLIEARCNVGLQHFFDGRTPIYAAAQYGHVSVTKQLIEARCNINLQDEHGSTPLSFAAYQGHALVTKQLIESRCNVDLLDAHEEKSNANLRISGSCAWCPQIANCMD